MTFSAPKKKFGGKRNIFILKQSQSSSRSSTIGLLHLDEQDRLQTKTV